MRAYEFLIENEVDEGWVKNTAAAAGVAMALAGSPTQSQAQEVTTSAISQDMQFAIDKAIQQLRLKYGNDAVILKTDVKPSTNGRAFQATVRASIK